eukprot:c24600_g1_i7 orf=611-856(+)
MSEEFSIRSFHSIVSTLDVVLDETSAPNPTLYNISTFNAAANITDMTLFPSLLHKRVWRCDKRVGNAFSIGFLADGTMVGV